MKKFLIFFTFLSFVLLPLTVSAQWGQAQKNLKAVADPTQLESSFETSVSGVITAALSLLGTIFLLLMVYAGILWMTARGNEDKVTKAKDIIIAAIIGLIIVMSAYAITSFVTGKLGGGSSTSEPSTSLYCKTLDGGCGPIETADCTDSSPNYTNNQCQ